MLLIDLNSVTTAFHDVDPSLGIHFHRCWAPEQFLYTGRFVARKVCWWEVQLWIHIGLFPLLKLILIGDEVVFRPTGQHRFTPEFGEKATVWSEHLDPFVTPIGDGHPPPFCKSAE